jgi:hypothetical protein
MVQRIAPHLLNDVQSKGMNWNRNCLVKQNESQPLRPAGRTATAGKTSTVVVNWNALVRNLQARAPVGKFAAQIQDLKIELQTRPD